MRLLFILLMLMPVIAQAQTAVAILDAWVVDGKYSPDSAEDDTFTPSAGTNRIFIVCLSGEKNTNGPLAVTNVSLGGQNLTEVYDFIVGSTTAYHNMNWVGYLLDAGIESMSGNELRIAWTAEPLEPFDSAHIFYAVYEHVDQGGGTSTIVDQENNTNTAATSLNLSSTITAGEGDQILAFNVVGQHDGLPSVSTSGYTEELEYIGQNNGHCAAVYSRDATTSVTENITFLSVTSERMAVSAIVLNFTAPPSTGQIYMGIMDD